MNPGKKPIDFTYAHSNLVQPHKTQWNPVKPSNNFEYPVKLGKTR